MFIGSKIVLYTLYIKKKLFIMQSIWQHEKCCYYFITVQTHLKWCKQYGKSLRAAQPYCPCEMTTHFNVIYRFCNVKKQFFLNRLKNFQFYSMSVTDWDFCKNFTALKWAFSLLLSRLMTLSEWKENLCLKHKQRCLYCGSSCLNEANKPCQRQNDLVTFNN